MNTFQLHSPENLKFITLGTKGFKIVKENSIQISVVLDDIENVSKVTSFTGASEYNIEGTWHSFYVMWKENNNIKSELIMIGDSEGGFGAISSIRRYIKNLYKQKLDKIDIILGISPEVNLLSS